MDTTVVVMVSTAHRFLLGKTISDAVRFPNPAAVATLFRTRHDLNSDGAKSTLDVSPFSVEY